MSMPLMDKWDIFTKPVFFPIPSPSDVGQDMPLAILVKKKKCECLCTYIHYFMYNKEMGKGTMKEYCCSQDLVEPNCGFLIEMSSWAGGTEFWSKAAGPLLSRHQSAAGIHHLYLHAPFTTVQVYLFY